MKSEDQLPIALEDIRRQINLLASIIPIPSEHLPTYQKSRDFGYPHLEWDNHGYHWVVIERGSELCRLTTTNTDDLLYIVFQSATLNMALEFELRNRIEGKDCRRMIWERQLQLLKKLKPEWAARRKLEIDEILTKHPYDDVSSLRAQLTGKLRDEGFDDQTAWQMACSRYPLQQKSVDNR